MRRFNWKARSVAIALLLLLVLVCNPELRAFLLILDFLGADLVVLLFGAYINHYWPSIAFYLRPVSVFVANGARSACKTLRWIAYGLHPRDGQWAHIDHIVLVGGVVRRIALDRSR